MSWEAWLVAAVLLVTLLSLFFEIANPDQIMLGALVLLWNAGVVPTETALKGFGNAGLVTVGALFVVAAAVDKSRILDRVGRSVLGTDSSLRWAMTKMFVVCFVLSAFFNNTPLVVLFMPIVRDWARQRDLAPSKLLIPLSYSAIMGGLTTMIGTSTNLVVAGLMEAEGLAPFGFFDPAKVALPVAVIVMLFIIAVGPCLLPDNKGGLFREVRERGDNMITAVEVTAESRFAGRRVLDVLTALELRPASLLKVRRRIGAPTPAKSPRPTATPDTILGCSASEASTEAVEPGDVLCEPLPGKLELPSRGEEPRPEVLAEIPEIIKPMSSLRVLNLDTEALLEDGNPFTELAAPIAPHERCQVGDVFMLSLPTHEVMEVSSKVERGVVVSSLHALSVLGPGSEFVELVLAQMSPITGQPIANADELIASHYKANMIALRQRNMRSRSLSSVPRSSDLDSSRWTGQSQHTAGAFSAGDVLLVLAARGHHFPSKDFLLVSRLGTLPEARRRWDLIPTMLFFPCLVLVVFDLISMVQVSVTLACFFVLGGWVPAQDIRSIVDWHLLILIGSALGVAEAMQLSGLSDVVAAGIANSGLPPALMPSGLYFVITLVTELVTNNAAAALGVPLAVSMAHEMGLKSPRPLIMVVLLAASTSYASPIGYATNLIVKGPGGYSFKDFLKIGVIVDILWLVCVGVLLPVIWPFE